MKGKPPEAQFPLPPLPPPTVNASAQANVQTINMVINACMFGQFKTLLKAAADCSRGKYDSEDMKSLQLKLFSKMFGLTKSETKLIIDWHKAQLVDP